MKVQLARSAEREQHLLDAATVVFVQRGFYTVRLEEIAREAGLSKRTLARSFWSKDLLIATLLHRFEGTSAHLTRRAHQGRQFLLGESLGRFSFDGLAVEQKGRGDAR